MTVYECKNRDRSLIHESLNPLLKIIFGNNHHQENNDFIDEFDNKVNSINIKPFTYSTIRKGKCIKDSNNKYDIEFNGYSGINNDKDKKIAIKTFLEVFTDIIPALNNDYSDEKTTEMGLIKTSDNEEYGIFFHDMAMEIIASHHDIHDILTKNSKEWEVEPKQNPIYLQLIQLTIAAFSNNPNINYDRLSALDLSLFDTGTTTYSGTNIKDNDFLYGIIWNPLHIEEEFNKYMGEDFYKIFCDYIDTIYLNKEKKITKKEKNLIINMLSSFMNLKLNEHLRCNMIIEEEAEQLRENFRKIRDNFSKQKNKNIQKIKK